MKSLDVAFVKLGVVNRFNTRGILFWNVFLISFDYLFFLFFYRKFELNSSQIPLKGWIEFKLISLQKKKKRKEKTV